MKITVSKKELLLSLKKVCSVTPGKTTLPILQYALIETDKLGTGISSTDLDQWVTVRIHGKIEKAGKGILPVRKMDKALKALPGSSVTITLEGNKVFMKCGKTTLEMETRPLEDFPQIPKVNSEFGLEIDPFLMTEILKKSLYAVSTDLTRPALTGVLFRLSKGRLTVVSTDGHRLCKIETGAVKIHDTRKPQDIIIPSKSLKILQDHAEKDGTLWAYIGPDWMQFSTYDNEGKGVMQLRSRLIEGPFPKFENVIPQHTDKTCTFSREDLLASVKRLSVFSNKPTNQIKFEVQPKKISLSAENEELGKASEDLECTANSTVTVGYNALYLQQALSTLESEELTLNLERPDTAALIQEELEEIKHMVIVMPLRLEG